jgi:DNA ligase-1
VEEADAAFAGLAAARGKGSASVRAERLSALLGRATAEERDFLLRLIVGELRQGALQGIMIEAIAAAAGLPVAEVRRAAMSAGGLGEVARAALTQGSSGLAQFSIRLMQPVLPMLSQTAEDTGEALALLGTAAFRVEARRRARAGAQGGRRGALLHAQPQRCQRASAGESWKPCARWGALR